jgi:hypothetical protein
MRWLRPCAYPGAEAQLQPLNGDTDRLMYAGRTRRTVIARVSISPPGRLKQGRVSDVPRTDAVRVTPVVQPSLVSGNGGITRSAASWTARPDGATDPPPIFSVARQVRQRDAYRQL